MRSRSAVRRASRSASVSGWRLWRRAIVGLLSGWGPPRWRADPPPPARACHHRVAGRPASGQRRSGGLVDVLVQLVADAVVGLGLDRLALGALLLARRALRRVVVGVGALDGPLEPGQRGGDVRAGELAQRLGG